MPWTTEQNMFIVEAYFLQKSIHAAQLQFKERFGCREFPVHSMIYRWVNKFRTHGTVHNFTPWALSAKAIALCEVHCLDCHLQTWHHWTIVVRGRERAVCDNQHRAIFPGAWQVLDSTWSTERGHQGPPVVPAGWCHPPLLKRIIGMQWCARSEEHTSEL